MTRLKLDENLSERLLAEARERGFDAENVRGESMSGATDDALHERCQRERRVLVTLDLDFADPIRFPLRGSVGTIMLRPPRPSMAQIASLFRAALAQLAIDSPEQSVWVVEPGRIRINQFWD